MQNPTLEDVIQLAKQAGEIVADAFGGALNIHHKGRIDLVTEVDHRSEEFIVSQIHQRWPQHSILAEESGQINGQGEQCWYIDPLDGTINYAHALPIFSVSIAYAERGHIKLAAVYDPSRDELFCSEAGKGARLNNQPLRVSQISELVDSLLVTGFPYSHDREKNNLDNFSHFFYKVQAVRRLGSAALDICYVAAGRIDGYWQLESHAWDVAAGALISKEAGATITTIDGKEDFFKPPYGIIVANPHIHPKMLSVLQQKE